MPEPREKKSRRYYRSGLVSMVTECMTPLSKTRWSICIRYRRVPSRISMPDTCSWHMGHTIGIRPVLVPPWGQGRTVPR